MAALTVSLAQETIIKDGHVKKLVTEYAAGSGTTDDTLTTTLVRPKKLLGIYWKYSAAPTYTPSLSAALDAGLGATYDIDPLVVATTADAAGSGQTYSYWIPGLTTAPTLWTATGYNPLGGSADEFIFGADDQLVVNVPDGGGAVTVTCRVVWEQLK